VTLATRLPDPLARARTTIAANVVPASQGETRREVLGSGDSRRAFPSFLLRQPPLTWLSASTPTGLLSTLSVWVDGVRWTPVESFEGTSPDDAVYVVRREDRGTVVQFGDGITGSRLPTGTANVRAVYRTGSGLGGRVGPGQLSLPTSRAGGVTGVTNPAGSEGGDDPEGVDSVRSSAPLRVLTLGRVVSLADYASFAKAFPGIAKAEAVWARAAAHRGVLLTVAGSRGAVVLPTTGIGAHLLAALAASGDPLVPVALLPYQPRSFRLAAAVKTADNRERDAVLAAVAARLRETFSFSRRGLGQPIAASEVVAEIQAVPGVVACTVTKLWVYSPDGGGAEPSGPPPDFLAAEAPTPGAEIGTVTGAELLVLDAAPIAWAVLS
jgi:predicted phage baseplate assembly protein